jgi:hypothetical protein
VHDLLTGSDGSDVTQVVHDAGVEGYATVAVGASS